ncbi:MAG: DUF1788 domain-containing protein [Planctomycetes bacterium]|nr:DUF1788 domain-containing protein [Planctomycetota bacterium]
MGKIEDLANLYEQHISAPWPHTVSGAQRVLMIVYDKELERTLRARIGEFEQRTRAAGKNWALVDCTRWFAEWMANDEYRDAYFESPGDLALKLEGEFKPHIVDRARKALRSVDRETVVGFTGIASLYGFLRISELIRDLEPDIRGRLAVFFPGSKEGGNIRLLDARDGWNYLAAVISLHGSGSLA